MHTTLAAALLSISTTAFSAILNSDNSQTVLTATSNNHVLRPLEMDDLPDFTTVYIKAFSPAAMWKYMHLDDEKNANYTYRCTIDFIREQWDRHGETNWANVITVPKHPDDDGRTEQVVSFAVWKWFVEDEEDAAAFSPWLSPLHLAKCSDHLDLNLTRNAYLERISNEMAVKYVYSLGQPQLYLNLLATHPDWDGHGFGAEQVEVGMKEAARTKMPLTLIGTPAGYPLYDSLGFKSVDNITIEKMDGNGEFWMEYMRWDAEPEKA